MLMTVPELHWHHRPVVLLPDFSFCLKLVMIFLLRTDRDHLDYRSDGHAYEADDDAGEPLLERERGSVREITKELYYYDLEYDSAAKHGDKHVVV